MNSTILIIDDEDDIRNLLQRIIRLEGHEVITASTAKEGFEKAKTEPLHCIICDVKLPDGNGVKMVEPLKELAPLAEIVLLTAFGAIPDSVTAIKSGAFDYITKGDDNHRIIPIISRAIEKSQLRYKVKALEAKIDQPFQFDHIIAEAPLTKQAVAMARKVAITDTTILLTGETGTGKEVFAQAIHEESPRSNQSFVAINCSALGRELLESELFGHKAGSFTGATKDKRGLFEEADKGTLFLDEIGEMDLQLQAKLLRVLESGCFIKVGETKETKVDVRLIAATNRDLNQEAQDGKFRLDLYYRLSVFSIHLAPLRERLADIKPLVEYFIQRMSAKFGRKPPQLTPEFLTALEAAPWKGNIRELRNAIERSVILSSSESLEVETLPIRPVSETSDIGSFLLADIEKYHIKKVLAITGENKTKSAQMLGIGLTTLYRKIEEYQL